MNNTYLIYGNNYKLIKKEIDNICDGLTDIAKYDLSEEKIDSLIDEALVMSMFEDKKVLIGENALFLTNCNNGVNHDLAYLENYLKDDNKTNIVILTVNTDKLDERKRVVKLLKEKAKVIKIEDLTEKDLPSFVISNFKNRGYEIDFKTASYFVSYVGKNVDIILNEIDKMILYKEDDKKITTSDIDNLSSKAFKDNIFDLLDGIMKKDYEKIFDCYKDLKRVNEEPIKIISMLGKQVLFVYKVKLLSKKMKSQKEISSLLKVHPYRVKLACEYDFLDYELKELLILLHDLDLKIKKGIIEKNHALEKFLISV